MLLRATLRRASKQEIRTSAVSLKVLSLVVTCHHLSYFEDTVVCLNPEILDWNNVNKVICNSSKCNQSGYMHAECFR